MSLLVLSRQKLGERLTCVLKAGQTRGDRRPGAKECRWHWANIAGTGLRAVPTLHRRRPTSSTGFPVRQPCGPQSMGTTTRGGSPLICMWLSAAVNGTTASGLTLIFMTEPPKIHIPHTHT